MSLCVFTEVLGSSTFLVIGLLLNLKNSFLASHLRGILNVSLVRLQGKETLTAHNHLYFRKVY